MRLTLHPPVLATSPALRLSAAVAASLALHAVVLAPSGPPPGSPLGRAGAGTPLAARIVAVPAQTPTERASPAPATPARPAVEPDQAASARQATPPPVPPPAADAPALGLPGAPVYYLQSELDVRARMQGHVDPPYPATAPPEGGYVVLRLLISEEGQVERVLVVVAEPEGYFEQAATEAFAAARFFPGRRGDVAVKSQTFIELKFHPLVPTDAAASGAPATDAATTAASQNP
jgi:TonB family protein